MQVLKFGGTSVGSVENMRQVAEIVKSTIGPKIVVLSAMSGVTNQLVRLSEQLQSGDQLGAEQNIQSLNNKYLEVIGHLLESEECFVKAQVLLQRQHHQLLELTKEKWTPEIDKVILAQGELVSTNLFHLYLNELELGNTLLSALDFMRIDQNAEPDLEIIEQRLKRILSQNEESTLFITQGFICRNPANQVDNLKRGGSDYTASLIGAAIGAREIQIWTDIDGMHNNDPRYVDETYSIEEVSFDEAAELAYFGAKILHPQSIIPAQESGIPVRVKNTFQPEAHGTLIHSGAETVKIRAVAAKDGITAIKIKSYRMLMAYGFLKKVFDVFESYKTSIDMITTSEVAVSLTIDDTVHLDEIKEELKGFGNIEVDTDLSIICIAGDIAQNKKGITAMIFTALKDIPIRMISYGGSNYNMSFLVKTRDKISVLNQLNHGIFEEANLLAEESV